MLEGFAIVVGRRIVAAVKGVLVVFTWHARYTVSDAFATINGHILRARLRLQLIRLIDSLVSRDTMGHSLLFVLIAHWLNRLLLLGHMGIDRLGLHLDDLLSWKLDLDCDIIINELLWLQLLDAPRWKVLLAWKTFLLQHRLIHSVKLGVVDSVQRLFRRLSLPRAWEELGDYILDCVFTLLLLLLELLLQCVLVLA